MKYRHHYNVKYKMWCLQDTVRLFPAWSKTLCMCVYVCVMSVYTQERSKSCSLLKFVFLPFTLLSVQTQATVKCVVVPEAEQNRSALRQLRECVE